MAVGTWRVFFFSLSPFRLWEEVTGLSLLTIHLPPKAWSPAPASSTRSGPPYRVNHLTPTWLSTQQAFSMKTCRGEHFLMCLCGWDKWSWRNEQIHERKSGVFLFPSALVSFPVTEINHPDDDNNDVLQLRVQSSMSEKRQKELKAAGVTITSTIRKQRVINA